MTILLIKLYVLCITLFIFMRVIKVRNFALRVIGQTRAHSLTEEKLLYHFNVFIEIIKSTNQHQVTLFVQPFYVRSIHKKNIFIQLRLHNIEHNNDNMLCNIPYNSL